MFTPTTPSRTTRNAALIALALSIPAAANAATSRRGDMAFSVRASRPSIVHIVQPSPWPAGNDATIRTDALRKKDDDNSRHKSDGFTIVRLDNGSPFPGGTGSQTRLDEARNNPKKDKDNNRHSRRDGEEITYVRIDHGAPTPGNLDNNVQVEGLSSAPAPKASNPFKNLELSSQARLAAAAPHIPAATPLNPPSRGRAWYSVSSDGSNGTEAGAGWTWTLR
jgi:hypothetical protein